MDCEEIFKAMRLELECYRSLAKLTSAQHECIQNSRSAELLAVLGKRQEFLKEIAKLRQITVIARRNWGEFIAGLAGENRSEAESLNEETRSLIEQIAAADRDDTLAMQQKKLEVGRKINQAASARKFNRAYAAAAYGQGKPGLDIHR
jgi:hypothetical protein